MRGATGSVACPVNEFVCRDSADRRAGFGQALHSEGRMNHALMVLMVCVISGSAASARDQSATQRDSSAPTRSRIYKLEELTWPRIDALDRERTMFILPVGMVEQHGPHLPVGADTLGVTYEANGVSRRVIRALPGWNVVMMPPINYGQSGANQLGNMLVHPGTYSIRQSTLRSLVADLGGQVAQNGFKWIFVMNGHGAPTHNIALNEACDFVSETFRVTMLHLTGLFRADAAIQSSGERMTARHFSAAEISSFGMDVHAGLGETSGMLAVRPDLVRPNYKTLPSRSGRTLDELREIASAPGWQGYLSSPAKATAAYGRAVETWWIDGFTDLILRAVRGENLLVHARVPDTVPPAVAPILEKSLANETAFESKLETWLVQRRKR
jgi:creatinine amidohydrolase